MAPSSGLDYSGKLKRELHCDILSTWRSIEMEEKEIKDRLLKENLEFRKAFDEHQKLEKKLASLQAKNYLTEEEKLKEKQLKKNKLLLKDKMYYMMTQFKKSRE
jgi:uncharacterized protein YdcH (DUF465 family)